MAYEIPGFKLTLVCGSGSLSTKQYTFVKMDTDGTAITGSAITDKMIGILQNSPGVGGECELMVNGVGKVYTTNSMSIGDKVGVHTDGTAITLGGSETTANVYGICLEASGGTGQLATILFSCMQHNLLT